MYRYCHTSDKPATDTSGRRVTVRFEGGREVTVGWDYAWIGSLEDRHRAAVVEAVKRLGGREYSVGKASTSRHGFRFDLFELVSDDELVALLGGDRVG